MFFVTADFQEQSTDLSRLFFKRDRQDRGSGGFSSCARAREPGSPFSPMKRERRASESPLYYERAGAQNAIVTCTAKCL